MTNISSNSLIHNAQHYHLMSENSLLKPIDIGLFTGGFASTDNPGGFLYSAAIEKNRLYLKSVECYLDPPKKLWYKLKYIFSPYPPRINGVKPVCEEVQSEEDHGGVEKYYPYYIWYDNLSIPLSYTGGLLAISSPNNVLDIDANNPGTFAEKLTCNFKKGRLVTLDSVRGNLEHLPPPKKPSPLIDPLQVDLINKLKSNK